MKNSVLFFIKGETSILDYVYQMLDPSKLF